MNPKQRKRLKQIAHHLDPVIFVGESGLSDAVAAETQRALADHELIKVRVNGADRAARADLADRLAQRCGATVVQRIGKVVVLYRANPQPKPALSNLTRYGAQSGR